MTAKTTSPVFSDWDNLADQRGIVVDIDTQADILRFSAFRNLVINSALTIILSVAWLIGFALLIAPSIAAIWFDYDLPETDQGQNIVYGLVLILATFFLYIAAWNLGAWWAIFRKKVPPVFAATPGLNIGEMKYKVEDDALSIARPLVIAQMHLRGMNQAISKEQFVTWNLGNWRFGYMICNDASEADQLAQSTNAHRAKVVSNRFDVPDDATMATENISAKTVWKTLAAHTRDRGKDPTFRWPFLKHLAEIGFVFLALLFAAFHPFLETFRATSPYLFGGAIMVASLALMHELRVIYVQMPDWRRLADLRYGHMKGHDWGQTAVRCDANGLEVYREYVREKLLWEAVDTLDRNGDLMVLVDANGGRMVLPYLQDASRLLTQDRLRRGIGPWQAPAAQPSRTKPPSASWKNAKNMVFWIFIFLSVFAIFSLASAKPARADLVRDPILPTWLDDVAVRPWDQDRDAGVRNRWFLYDQQILVNAGGYQRVTRSLAAASDRSYLETIGEITVFVDPSSEVAALHKLVVLRGKQTINHIDLNFTELRRETGLEDGIFSGNIEYVAQIPDLRIGDIIELVWSVQVKPSVFSDDFYYTVRPRVFDEGAIDRVRILLPAHRPHDVQMPDLLRDDYTRQNTNGMIEHIWQANTEAPEFPDGPRPAPWDISNDFAQISTFSNWAEIAAGLQDTYAPKPELLPDDLIAIVDEIEARFDDPKRQTTEVLRLVQDQLRYFSVAIGEGGWIPRSPELSWRNRFGDCKDKALLMISILDHLGIAADVILVNSERGAALQRSLPSPFVFDHAIVRIRDEDGDWFVDPTDVLQGGVGRDIYVGDFAWGLPLSPGSADLVPITRMLPKLPTHEVLQDYTFHPDGPLAATLRVSDIYRGHQADNQRWRYDGEDLIAKGNGFQAWYDRRFPGATLNGQLVVNDNLNTNTFEILQVYDLPRQGFESDGLWTKLWHRGYAVIGKMRALEEDDVLRGITDMGPPINALHTVTMRNLPAPLNAPSQDMFENAFIRFDRSGSWNDESLVWTRSWHLESYTTIIEPGDEIEWRTAETVVDDNDHYWVNLHAQIGAVLAQRPVLLGMSMSQFLVLAMLFPFMLIILLVIRRSITAEIASREKDAPHLATDLRP